MKKFFPIVSILVITANCFSQVPQDYYISMDIVEIPPTIEACDEDEIESYMGDQLPTGGYDRQLRACIKLFIRNFLRDNFDASEYYKSKAQNAESSVGAGYGSYLLKIGDDGKITEVKIRWKSDHLSEFTEEIKEVFMQLPTFNPAKQRDRNVGATVVDRIWYLGK